MFQFPRTFPKSGPERDRLLKMEEQHPLVPGKDPAAELDRVGTRVRELVLRLNEQENSARELWKRYLAACHKHGVQPRAI